VRSRRELQRRDPAAGVGRCGISRVTPRYSADQTRSQSGVSDRKEPTINGTPIRRSSQFSRVIAARHSPLGVAEVGPAAALSCVAPQRSRPVKASLSLFYAASCRSCNTFHLRLSAISDAAKCGPSRGGLAIAPPGGTPNCTPDRLMKPEGCDCPSRASDGALVVASGRCVDRARTTAT
jgi:hypothetical protein